MSFQINDGRGKNGLVGVSSDQRLNVSARQNKRIFYVSRDEGRAFVWLSTFATGTTNVEVFYLKNTSTIRKLYIDSMRYSASATTILTVFKHTGTASGTGITGENLNFTSTNDAEATALGDGAVTAGTIGNGIAFLQVVPNADSDRNWNGEIILGQGDSIIITCSTDVTIHLGVTGFYE